MQPSGSFKIRGIGNLMKTAIRRNKGEPIHFYCSSGGNAGLACATVARMVGHEATIVVPRSTSQLLVKKLKDEGAEVQQLGEDLAAADLYLRKELIGCDPNAFYVPPFDHPLIWAGQETLLGEVEQQMAERGGFDAVVCSVGGGSMLIGIQQTIKKKVASTREKAPLVLAVETRGAESLNASLLAGRHITLDKITSIATSLGVSKVAERAYRLAQEPNVRSVVLSDAEAAMACVRFADEERILVETSCGVSLATVYNGVLKKLLGAGMSEEDWSRTRVVISVCGGSDVSPERIKEYRKRYGEEV
ncbi:L-serine deaminase [Hyphodiscus hymeniophilus]|uniref:L-serine ammonia-lyase n=1 Tax=Hyphodiscus hymeniophilus TaxID=353542 RepID=A0A9P6VJD6_9HELO|nr:L-serine deaminase [Hyphodiscus hymeniophilus]